MSSPFADKIISRGEPVPAGYRIGDQGLNPPANGDDVFLERIPGTSGTIPEVGVVVNGLPNARGRIDGEGLKCRFVAVGNGINGARLLSYDPETRTVVVRVDDSRMPAFWLEVPISLDQLEAFVAAETLAVDEQ